MRQNQKNVSPMSNEGRNAYVIQHITDAMLTLLREKPMNEISISELCGLAGVGRASFYRNYENKEAILKMYMNEILQEWADQYKQEKDFPLEEQIRSLFTHFEKHMDFYRLLNERGLICLLKDVITGIFGPKPEYSKIEAYTTAFVSYSLYGWIEVWFQRGMQESAEEMADMFQGVGV